MAIAWTIAGSDSSGDAGIQADLHTFKSLGVHGCSVITAITAQNSVAIEDILYLPDSTISAQLHALQKDYVSNTIKLGMLGRSSTITIIHDFLKTFSGHVILDPVLISSSNYHLFTDNLAQYIACLKSIFQFVSLLTPNIKEAELLLNTKISSTDDVENAAADLLKMGLKSVLIKGGHLNHNVFSQDYWTDGQDSFWISGKRISDHQFRGTGCTLSSAIAAALALGYEIKDALVIAKMYISQSIRNAKSIAQGKRLSLSHQSWPNDQRDFPLISKKPLQVYPKAFNHCGQTPLGLYPVIDDVHWLKRLLPLGINTIQLRIKNKSGKALLDEIKESVVIAKQYNTRLFINDYWEYAIEAGAYGVHLGQEDISNADIQKIHRSGLRLGISTHSYFEISRALALNPSYIAFGPIFTTYSKIMPYLPQGTEQLRHFVSMFNYPMVAIGGINLERLPNVLNTKVSGIAMISAITQADDPEKTTVKLLEMISNTEPGQL